MAVEQTLILAKPDAVRRSLAGEIVARFERRGFQLRAARLLRRRPGARRAALRRALREAVLRRARRVHHVGADARVRARGRGSDRDRADDDRRDESRRCRAGLASRRVRVGDAGQPRARLRLARVGRGARSRSGFPTGLSEPDYVAVNRAAWTQANAEYTDAKAHDAWLEAEITWGTTHAREAEIGVLPEFDGKDVVELGCGTAYFGAWLARRRRAGRRRRRHAGAARDRAPDGGRVRARARVRRSERRGDRAAGRELRPRASRSTARRSGATRRSGSPRRRGCCGRAATSSSCATRRSRCSAATADGGPVETLQRPQRGLYKHRLERAGRDRVSARPRRLDRRAARERLRDRAAGRAVRAPATRSTTSTTTRTRSGRRSGRAKRFGAPALRPR